MNILAIIPARGGSKGIPEKNIISLSGKPLISYTIEAAKQSELLGRSILSSDDEKIINVANKFGLEAPFVRPEELAQDDTPALPVIKHAVTFMEQELSYKADYVVLLQPTSPLRTTRHIDEAVEKLINSDADSIVSVVEVPHQFIPHSIMQLDGAELRPYLSFDESQNLRQKKPTFYARNGAAIYAFSYECLMKKNSIYGDKILPYFMTPEESIDIDSPWDLEICEFFLQKRAGNII
jgi:CMP-N,N'-diacetyllegionaminic acid synthase